MKTYLALDVGGSSIKYALIQEDSTILEKSSVPTPMDTMDHFVETIGEIYDDSMIGQKVNYSSNGQSNWIIFGKDESGNVLLTTERPIPNEFELTVGPESWLTYKEDLKQAIKEERYEDAAKLRDEIKKIEDNK